jgi:hypothetical protein
MSHAQLNAGAGIPKSSYSQRYSSEIRVERLSPFSYKISMAWRWQIVWIALFGLGLGLVESGGAGAIELRGRFYKSQGHYTIRDGQSRLWHVRPGHHEVATQLERLNNDDYIDASVVEVESEVRKYLVEGIHFVGLCGLLGLWVADDSTVVDFATFNDMSLYLARPGTLRSVGLREQFAYTLAPEDSHNWTVFLIHGSQVLTGRLRLERASAELEVWDGGVPKLGMKLKPVYRAATCQ